MLYFFFIFQDDDDHIALYDRAKTYVALGQLDQALIDIERVILLKSHWAKVTDFFNFVKEKQRNFQGYYYRSEILFEMKHFTKALLSSFQGLTLNPEDQIGKQIMARVSDNILLFLFDLLFFFFIIEASTRGYT